MALFIFNPPQWLFGVVGVIISLMWGSWIYSIFNTEQVDISELLDAGLDEAQEERKNLNK